MIIILYISKIKRNILCNTDSFHVTGFQVCFISILQRYDNLILNLCIKMF